MPAFTNPWVLWSDRWAVDKGTSQPVPASLKCLGTVQSQQEIEHAVNRERLLPPTRNRSLHLFRTGTIPSYAGQNLAGGHFSAQLADPSGQIAADLWWRLAMNAADEERFAPFADNVVGVTVLRKPQHFGFKIWMNDSRNQQAVSAARTALRGVLLEIPLSLRFKFSPHRFVLETIVHREKRAAQYQNNTDDTTTGPQNDGSGPRAQTNEITYAPRIAHGEDPHFPLRESDATFVPCAFTPNVALGHPQHNPTGFGHRLPYDCPQSGNTVLPHHHHHQPYQHYPSPYAPAPPLHYPPRTMANPSHGTRQYPSSRSHSSSPPTSEPVSPTEAMGFANFREGSVNHPSDSALSPPTMAVCEQRPFCTLLFLGNTPFTGKKERRIIFGDS